MGRLHLRREPEAVRASIAEVLRWHGEGSLDLLPSRVFPLERAAETLAVQATHEALGARGREHPNRRVARRAFRAAATRLR